MDIHAQLWHTPGMISCQLSRSKIIQSVIDRSRLGRIGVAAHRQRIDDFGFHRVRT